MKRKLVLISCFGLLTGLLVPACADDGGDGDENAMSETGDGDGDPGDGDGEPGDGDGEPGDGDGEPGDGDGEPGDGDGEPGDGDGEPGDGDDDSGDGDGEPGDGDGEPGDGDGEPGDGDGDPGDGDGDGDPGNCAQTHETCDALQAAFVDETQQVRGCTEDAECGQVLTGTSCGCTRDWVAREDADTDCFYMLIEQAGPLDCDLGLLSTCDCPQADGFACEQGICVWNYI